MKNDENKIQETLSENSFQSKGKNFILKSDFLNNTSNSKKNSNNNIDSSNNNEKIQTNEEIEKNKTKNISNHISDKEIDLNILNTNIFNENQNKSNTNHSNIVHDYYQDTENNIELIKNQLNNINLSGNEINQNNKINNNNSNIIINEINNSDNIAKINNLNEKEINNNMIKNEPNNIINKNPTYLNQNIEEQSNLNFQNVISNTSNQNQNLSQFYQNQLNNFVMNQNQINPNFNSFQNNFMEISENTSNKKKLLSTLFNNPNNPTNIISEKRGQYLLNNCVSVCKGQLECRQLQKMIEIKPSLASNIIYPKIKDKLQEISFDQFGNYFIQKVIEYLNENQIKELLQKKISHNFRSFCFNQHGTRVIQKIFEKIVDNESLLNYFNNLLKPNLKDFVIDQNASHIIIKYVNTLPSPKNDFIIQFLLENSYELAMKKYSCCVLQKCIEYSNDKQKKNFLKQIAIKSFGLFNDQFGNYVVQYCINLCDFEINKIFVDNFLNNILKFSTQKYSSNIIEKCMDCSDESTRELICEKYCKKEIVEKLLFDNYGNYVLQKVIALSKEPLTSKYLEMVGPLMVNLSSLSFGQRLYNKLISSYPNLLMYIGGPIKQGKNRRFKNKKKNSNIVDGYMGNNNFNNINSINGNGINNMKMNEFVNNIYVNNNYNMNNINNNFDRNNNNGNIFMTPGINNYYFPYQLNNNVDNINNFNNIIPNNIQLQNLLNTNNFAIEGSISNNNINKLIQLRQRMNINNNNIDFNSNYYNSNQ